eukprot:CAMPEP_0170589106 /NCGR_PEP_ID=MMETSP0224-20130122/11180_1 /TAXON_ID=285029 /ORGANISM="Togula jolla, Strain CCCM 725" /LENGTH=495 /DNA_ID=CAMNT_0010912855 /DNA_START=51 /DNA_END=1538 /DNA_ORIENTATION=+
MAFPTGRCLSKTALWLSIFGFAPFLRAQAKTESECAAVGGSWQCRIGCYDFEDELCISGLNEMSCAEIYNHVSWSARCGCQCVEQICEVGCWDPAQETCMDFSEAECSGGMEWAEKCNCQERTSGGDDFVESDKTGSANIYFSVPAFVVLFRESLEVVIILAVIIQFLNKSKDDGTISEELFYRLRREVYFGATWGFCVCLVMGIGFLVLASFAYQLFEGKSRTIFEGSMMFLTSIILSFLALNFYKMIHTREAHERKMHQTVTETVHATLESEAGEAAGKGTTFGKKHAFFVLAFTTGLREGLESIIFLVGVVSDVDDLSSLPLAIVLALVLARVVGCCFFQGTKKMNVEWFMRGSAALLCLIAAGFMTSSMHSLQELEVFGTWSPRAERPWQNQRMYDARECCNDKTNRFFVLMRAMLGWQDQATPVELFAYLTYWIIALTLGWLLVRRAKKQLQMLVEKWRLEDELRQAQGKKILEQEELHKNLAEADGTQI